MHKTDPGKRLGEQTTRVCLENTQMIKYMKGEQKRTDQNRVTDR